MEARGGRVLASGGFPAGSDAAAVAAEGRCRVDE